MVAVVAAVAVMAVAAAVMVEVVVVVAVMVVEQAVMVAVTAAVMVEIAATIPVLPVAEAAEAAEEVEEAEVASSAACSVVAPLHTAEAEAEEARRLSRPLALQARNTSLTTACLVRAAAAADMTTAAVRSCEAGRTTTASDLETQQCSKQAAFGRCGSVCTHMRLRSADISLALYTVHTHITLHMYTLVSSR